MANCIAFFFIHFWRGRDLEPNRSQPLFPCLVVTCPVLPLSPSTLLNLHEGSRELLTPLLFSSALVSLLLLQFFLGLTAQKIKLAKGLFASRRHQKVPPHIPSLPSSHECLLILSPRCPQPFKKVVEKTLEFCRLTSP